MRLCKGCGQELKPRKRLWYEQPGYGDLMPRKWCNQDCADEWYANEGVWVYAVRVVWKRASGGLSGRRSEAACEKCSVKRVSTDVVTRPAWANRDIVDRRWNTSFEVAHIIPIAGGKRNRNPLNIPSNLVLLCFECHRHAHNWRRHAEEVGYLSHEPEPMELRLFSVAALA